MLATLIDIALVNVLLSSDNVLIIALFSGELGVGKKLYCLISSMLASLILQLGTLFVMAFLFRITFLKSLFGLLICYMAFHLLQRKKRPDVVEPEGHSLWYAIWRIVVGNLMMSFENEAALIIISHGNVWIAWLGILVTSPLIFFVSHLLTWLLDKYAFILYIGSIVLIKIGLDLIFTMKPLTPYVPIAPWAFTGVFAVFVSVLYIKEPLI